MSGSNRNIRLADWLHTYLHEVGPKCVSEITDYINNEQPTKRSLVGREKRNTKHTYSSNQITGVLKSNPLFQTVRPSIEKNYESGTTSRWKSPKTGRWVADWEARPIREVVDNMIEKRDSGIPLRRFQPQVVKNEFKRRGLKL